MPTDKQPAYVTNPRSGGIIRIKPCMPGRRKQGATRGFASKEDVVDTLCDDFWDQIQEWCANNTMERDYLIEYFNGIIEGEDELGTLMFSDDASAVSFKDKYNLLADDEQEKLT